MLVSADGEYTGQWPPEDPTTSMEEKHAFALPKEPWTYGNGSFNPDLHPSRGSPVSRQRRTYPYPSEGGETDGTRTDSPYHPIYDESQPSHEHLSRAPYEDEGEDDHYYDDRPQRQQFIRRGSEGYEVRPIDREEMMRQYVDSQSHFAALSRAQERADMGDENYGVSDEDGGGDKLADEDAMEKEVIERMGEVGRYRPYVPERWESEDEDDEMEPTPNGLPVQD